MKTKSKRPRWRRKPLAAHLGVDPRTLDRWVRAGKIAKPVYLGRMPTWGDEVVEEIERNGVSEAAA
jgi:predicted site-specific integrase-resolvase